MKISLLILTLCCLLFAGIAVINIAEAVSIPAGEQAPDFTLPSIDGSVVSLTDFKGSVVVLIYFRADQKRSIMALEEIKVLQTKFRKKEVQFIGISAEKEKKDALLNKMKEPNIDFPVLFDVERDVYGSYGIRVYPTTLIIDRRGKVAAAMPGHALSYKIRLDGTIQFVLGDIDESELKKILSPKKKVTNASVLFAERKYNLALRFTEARLFDHAIEFVKQSIAAKPDMAKSHVLLGYLFLDAQETDSAIEQFKEALHIEPSSKDAGTGLGSTLIEKGDFDKAIDVLSKALFLNPNPERTLYELGRAYELQGEKESAVEMYKKSLEKIIAHHVLPSSVAHCR